MSDGTLNFPNRSVAPSTPTTGRTKLWVDDVTGEPYYTDDTGSSQTLKGDQGDQGPQGPQGIQGIQGDPGPQGPVSLDFDDEDSTLLTLPNSTTDSVVRTWSINFPATAEYRIQLLLGVRPHSAGNDYRFECQLDGTPVANRIEEEGKDTSAAQSNPRMIQGTLGIVSAGTLDLDLLFSKESTGGTAELKYTSLFIWRVS